MDIIYIIYMTATVKSMSQNMCSNLYFDISTGGKKNTTKIMAQKIVSAVTREDAHVCKTMR
jgi:hypothetical protein